MLGIVSLLGSLGTLVLGQVAARWGLKLAIIASILAVFSAVWVGMGALLAVAIAVIPSPPIVDFAAQFLPSTSALSAGAGVYLTTLVSLRHFDYWRMSAGVVAKLGAA